MRPIDVARKLCPGAKRSYLAAIEAGDALFARYGITTPLRLAHFFAQIFHESGGLTIDRESGAYRYETILKVFGAAQYARQYGGKGHSAKITPAEARKLANMPVAQRGPALFERVYGLGNPAKARELGNTQPGDGWRYRGGGLIQTTGRANFRKRGKKCGVDLEANPDLITSAAYALLPALAEWAEGKLNAAADRDDILTITHKINGGENGLVDRKAWLKKLKATIKSVEIETGEAQGLLSVPGDGAAHADDTPAAEEAPPPAGDDEADAELSDVQRRLSAMHYSAGIPNGQWGGMTAGAIAGFINDRQMTILAPTSREAFDAVEDELLAEIAEAEGEGFTRPVTEARASADPKTVAQVAPEVVPAKRGFLITVWTAITTFFAAVWQAISDSVSSAWKFFTDHKDDVPADSGILSAAWDYLGKVPTWVWLLAAAVGLAIIAINAHASVKKITASVQSGARQ